MGWLAHGITLLRAPFVNIACSLSTDRTVLKKHLRVCTPCCLTQIKLCSKVPTHKTELLCDSAFRRKKYKLSRTKMGKRRVWIGIVINSKILSDILIHNFTIREVEINNMSLDCIYILFCFSFIF